MDGPAYFKVVWWLLLVCVKVQAGAQIPVPNSSTEPPATVEINKAHEHGLGLNGTTENNSPVFNNKLGNVPSVQPQPTQATQFPPQTFQPQPTQATQFPPQTFQQQPQLLVNPFIVQQQQPQQQPPMFNPFLVQQQPPIFNPFLVQQQQPPVFNPFLMQQQPQPNLFLPKFPGSTPLISVSSFDYNHTTIQPTDVFSTERPPVNSLVTGEEENSPQLELNPGEKEISTEIDEVQTPEIKSARKRRRDVFDYGIHPDSAEEEYSYVENYENLKLKYDIQVFESECGVTPNIFKLYTTKNERTFPGRKANYGEFPWQVAVLKVDKRGSNFLCSGTLASSSVVVTAASCIKDCNSKTLEVRLGDWDIGDHNSYESYMELQLGVSYVYQHSEYSIAVLKLVKAVNMARYPQIAPICIPSLDYYANGQSYDVDTKEYTYCEAVGWHNAPVEKVEDRFFYNSKHGHSRILLAATVNPTAGSCTSYQSGSCITGINNYDPCTADLGSGVFCATESKSYIRRYRRHIAEYKPHNHAPHQQSIFPVDAVISDKDEHIHYFLLGVVTAPSSCQENYDKSTAGIVKTTDFINFLLDHVTD